MIYPKNYEEKIGFNNIRKIIAEYNSIQYLEFLGNALDVDTCKLYDINKFNRILSKKITRAAAAAARVCSGTDYWIL